MWECGPAPGLLRCASVADATGQPPRRAAMQRASSFAEITRQRYVVKGVDDFTRLAAETNAISIGPIENEPLSALQVRLRR